MCQLSCYQYLPVLRQIMKSAAPCCAGALHIADAQGEDSNSSEGVGKLVSAAKKGEDDKDDGDDDGLCADCCVIQ